MTYNQLITFLKSSKINLFKSYNKELDSVFDISIDYIKSIKDEDKTYFFTLNIQQYVSTPTSNFVDKQFFVVKKYPMNIEEQYLSENTLFLYALLKIAEKPSFINRLFQHSCDNNIKGYDTFLNIFQDEGLNTELFFDIRSLKFDIVSIRDFFSKFLNVYYNDCSMYSEQLVPTGLLNFIADNLFCESMISLKELPHINDEHRDLIYRYYQNFITTEISYENISQDIKKESHFRDFILNSLIFQNDISKPKNERHKLKI